MRGAFVVKVATGREPAEMEGCVEEVDTGKEIRFHNSDELVRFIVECLRDLESRG